MYHLSDKELDRLSQEAAEQYDVEANTSAWDALEKKLAVEMPLKQRRRRRFLLFLLAAALITGSSLYLVLTPNANKLAGTIRSSNKSAPVPENAGDNKVAPNTPAPDASAKSNADQKSSGKEQSSAFTDHTAQNNLKTKDEIIQSNSRATFNSANKKIRSTENKSANNNTRKQSASRSNQNHKELSPQDYVIIDMLSQTHPEPQVRVENIMEKAVRTARVKGVNNVEDINTSLIQPGDQNIALSSAPQKTKQQNKFLSRFEFGALVAPDMSSVEFKSSDKLGFNVGATISYRLSNRWSLQTGLIYTRKIYTATGSDYHPPKDYWTWSTDLHKVDGDCYMFDIPLNIRYDLNTNKRNRFFISGGLSSYLMKKETYNYYYTYNGEYEHREKSYETHLNHWFNIMNFSGGFEHSLNKKFSLQLEPYVKVPLQGIGFGSVDLSSYGIYFSLRYKPHW